MDYTRSVGKSPNRRAASEMDMAGAQPVGFNADFKRGFLRGLAALLPTLLTIVILVKGYQFIDTYLGQYFNRGIAFTLATVGIGEPSTQQLADANGDQTAALHARWNHRFKNDWYLHPVGVLLGVFLMYVVGQFLASFFGRALWRITEATIVRVPVIKTVYPLVKQVTDFLFSERRVEFNRVVAIQYPRKGIWSIGMVTGSCFNAVKSAVGQDMLSIFIPTSPAPMTGFVINVPRKDVIDLPMSLEEVFKYLVSAGVITPDSNPDDATQAKLPPAVKDAVEQATKDK